MESGYDEMVVKTKNKFYDMRGTLDHLRFEVVRYERNGTDNAASQVYLSKNPLPEIDPRHPTPKARGSARTRCPAPRCGASSGAPRNSRPG